MSLQPYDQTGPTALDERDAYALCQEAVRVKKAAQESTLDLCVLLDQIITTNAADNSATGGLHNLALQLGMKVPAVSKAAKVGRVLVREYGFTKTQLIGDPDKPTSFENLYYLSSAKSRDDAERLLSLASEQTVEDFKKTVGKVDECDHVWVPLTLRKCRTCKAVEKSFDTETTES